MTIQLTPSGDARVIFKQFLRFAAVGGAATAIHYAIMIALVELAGVSPVIATVIGFCSGAVASYFLNRRFTFGDSSTSLGGGMAKYFVVVGIGLALNTAIVWALTHLGLQYIIAQMAATGLVLFWNFFASRLFVFRD